MKIEIWSDVMCPFCYIGKRNLEDALARFDDKDQITIEWKSYQLDATIPEKVTDSYVGYLSKKRNVSEEQSKQMLESVTLRAREVGLDYQLDKAVITNSFKAHILLQLAKEQGMDDAMEERLFKAYFTEGATISDIATLVQLGTQVGLEESAIRAAFSNDTYAIAVRKETREAREIGVTGVPFFVLDRKYAVSGAQPAEVFLNAIQKSFQEWKEKSVVTNLNVTNGDTCSIEGNCD